MRKLIVISLLFLFYSSPSYSTVYNVTTTGDCISSPPGILCLREAILQANASSGADQINVPAGRYILAMTGRNDDTGATGDLDILATVSIVGVDPGNTIIDANYHDRAFHIPISSQADTVATFTNLTIRNGLTDETDVGSAGDEHGGGLFNDRRTAILQNVVVQNNQVVGDENSSIGGGLLNRGTMELYDCTVTNNDAHGGGGIFNAGSSSLTIRRSAIHNNTARAGGGMIVYGTFSLINSTIHSNTTDSYSTGGIFVGADTNGTISFCTISNNRGATQYGGIYLQGDNLVEITGSIISNNRISVDDSLVNCSFAPATSFSSSVYNLEDGDACGFSPTQNLINTDPQLGGLSRDGGLTPTLPLLHGSPAIDAVTAIVGLAEDQRGKHRPNGEYHDIGAFEYYGPVCFPVRAVNGEVTIICI